LGKPTETVFRCARCGGQEAPEVALEAKCGDCGSDLHSCTHCAEFDTSAPFECRREIPQRVARKAGNNECDLFRPKLVQEFGREVEAPSDAKAAFDDLFNF